MFAATPQMHDPLLKPFQVAEQLGVKTSTVWEWCRSGRLGFIVLSARNYRVRQSSVDDFLRSRSR